jgi:hypothetical protein
MVVANTGMDNRLMIKILIMDPNTHNNDANTRWKRLGAEGGGSTAPPMLYRSLCYRLIYVLIDV